MQAVDVVGVVEAVVAVRAGGRLEQPDLLVVADRAGRQADLCGDLLDPQELRWGLGGDAVSGAVRVCTRPFYANIDVNVKVTL